MPKPYYKTDKCPKGHKMTKIGMSACDDVYECKCGKWMKYCLGGTLIKFTKNMKIHKRAGKKLEMGVCGYQDCDGIIAKYESERYWSEACNKCGWGAGGSK